MKTLEEFLAEYFEADHEKAINCLYDLQSLTGISMEPVVRELDRITHEEY